MSLVVTDPSTPVVALVLRPSAVRHRVLPIARSAGRLGVSVHVLQTGRPEAEARSRYVTRVETLPADADDRQCLDVLLRLGRELGRAVLIPTDDAGTVLVDDHAAVLGQHFLLPRREPDLTRRLASKRELHLLCEGHGLPTAGAAFPGDEAEAVMLGRGLGFPVVMKRIQPWLRAADGRAPSVAVVRRPEEVPAYWRRMRSEGDANVMLQEWLPPTARSGWMYNAYFDDRSEPMVEFTGLKIRQNPPRSGVTSLGQALANDDVASGMRNLLGALGYRGIVDADLYHDERDGRYKLLDVNPRIGATFRLFIGEDGMDVLRAAYLDLTGHPARGGRQRLGRKWIAEPLDLDSALRLNRAGELDFGQWRASLRHVEEAAWFALDDPLPALAVTAPISRALLRRTARRRRKSTP